MLWLFGQIWLWLLVSFALGAAVTWFLPALLNRRRGEGAPSPVNAEVNHVEPPDHQDPADPGPASSPRATADQPLQPTEMEHSEGRLPPAEYSPDRRGDENGSAEEPAWPKEEDAPSAGQRPGSGR